MSNASAPGTRDPPFNHGIVTSIGDYVYPLFKRVMGDDPEFLAEINDSLNAARNETTREQFISHTLGVASITGGVMWAISFAAVITLIVGFGFEVGPLVNARIPNETLASLLRAIRTPLVMAFLALTVGSVSAAIGFAAPVLSTRFKADARAREINALLPDAIAYMYALSVGGLNHLEIIETVAESESVYGEVSLEFRTILRDMEYLDVDYRNAIRNRAVETPSDDLNEFFTDMLSIIDSGGDVPEFLNDKRKKHLKKVRNQQRRSLDSLSLFGEMYMTVSMFPVLLIIVLITMSLMGGIQMAFMYLAVYALIPLIAVAFIVLISTSKIDKVGGAFLPTDTPGDETVGESYVPDVTSRYKDRSSLLASWHRREQIQNIKRFLRHPVTYFTWNPGHTAGLTIPIAIAWIILTYSTGTAPATWDGMQAQSYWGTVVYFYIPVLIVMVVYSVFAAMNRRARFGILKSFTDALRKLSSANATGLTLLEAIETVANTTSGKLGREFDRINRNVKFGETVESALLNFNNQYQIPRLARTINLVTEAQKTSNHISHVLSTAAETSENHDDLERDQKQETRMQIAIIMMTSLTLLGVLALLVTQFLAPMSDLPQTSSAAGPGFNAIDVDHLSLILFHAVTLQAISAGVLSGYLRNGDLRQSGLYVVGLLIPTAVVWGVLV
jgi:flagellar protein FlaJ